ncbi:hypothetical protein [Streptomyces collinus]|uniref:hypothetical protein n=1 Tax=Streptomyces collinus TaxID=42684 RepID=UPI0036866993
MERAIRLWAEGFIAGEDKCCDRAEEALRRAHADRFDEPRVATWLASLLIRRASAAANSEWAWSSHWFDSYPFGDVPDDELECCETWQEILGRYQEAERLLESAVSAAPADAVAALTQAVLWLDRWELHRMLSREVPDDEELQYSGSKLAHEGVLLGRRAVDLCPTNPLSSLQLAVALVANNDTAEAADRYAYLEALLPDEVFHPGVDGLIARPYEGTPACLAGYSWYVLQRNVLWSNNGDLNTLFLVTTDSSKILRACEIWAMSELPPDGSYLFQVYDYGRLSTMTDLVTTNGLPAAIPPPQSEPLPDGMPTLSRLGAHGPYLPTHHGYSALL